MSSGLAREHGADGGPEKGSILYYLNEMAEAGGQVPADFTEQSVPSVVASELLRIAKKLVGLRGMHRRELYRPDPDRYDDVEEIKVPKDVDLEIWRYRMPGADGVYGIAFQGRAQKPLWHYKFRSESQFDRQVEKSIEHRRKWLERKKEQREERKKYRHDYKVGDILSSSWGYDQTNIDFYQVVATTEKSIVIRPIAQKIVRSRPPQDYVVPVKNKFTGGKERHRVGPGGYVRLTSFSVAKKWDGKPEYQTSSGWGH